MEIKREYTHEATYDIGDDMYCLACPECETELEIGDEIGSGEYWERDYEVKCNKCGWSGRAYTRTVCFGADDLN